MAASVTHFCFILLLSLLPTKFARSFFDITSIAQPPNFNGAPSPPPQGPNAPPPPKGPTPSTPPPPPPSLQFPSPTPIPPPTALVESSSGGLSGGGKAGIAIGVIAGATVLGLGAMVYSQRRSNIRRGQYGHSARTTFL